MKYEWKKMEKEIYLPKDIPSLIQIPKCKYFTIEGKGNPNNNQDFKDKIGILYSLSYAIRMMPKNGYTPKNYFEYTVYPLEGIWDLTKEGKESKVFNKNDLVYKIMIRQPDFVNEEVVNMAMDLTKKKKPSLLLDEVKFEEIEDGKCLQIMHIGSFDDEQRSFNKMEEFIKQNNYKKRSLTHKEIYLSDFNKVSKDKLKTVLRYYID